MKTVRYAHQHDNVACDLDTTGRGERADEWRRLRDTKAVGALAITGGARLRLRADAWDAAVDLARREAGCCGFLDFMLEADDQEIRLDITSTGPDAQAVAACLAGLEPDCVLDCC